MNTINAVLRVLFDALLYPFRSLPPLVGLTVVSLGVAVAMLLVFKATSNQQAIEAVKGKIHAGLYEIRLFNDDFRTIIRAQLDILRHNLSYLRYSLVPMLFILPPLVLVMAQLQFHYGYAPLRPGASPILEVTLAEGWQERADVPRSSTSTKPQAVLELPVGLQAETPAVWVPSERTLSWRLGVGPAGSDGTLAIVVGDQRFTKLIDGSKQIQRRSPVRPSPSFVAELLYPAEAPLPAAGPIETIQLELPAAMVPVFGGFSIGEMAGVPAWMVVFFVLSMVFAFALRKPLGVEI